MPGAFDKDGATTRRVLGTDNTGVELDGQVRSTVWDVGTTAWVRAIPGFASGGTINITGTVNTVGGSGQATVNINGFPTVNLGSWPTLNVGNQVIVSGTVNTVGGGGQATVNIAGAVVLSATVNGTFWQATQPISGNVTATVNLGSIGTVGVGSIPTVTIGFPSGGSAPTFNIGSAPTFNVGNTVTVSGNLTATTTIASAPTMNIGNSVNLGTVPTVNVGNTLNVATHAVTGNVTATVNFGSIGTVAVGNTVNVLGTATVNIGSAIPSGPNLIGDIRGWQPGRVASNLATGTSVASYTSTNNLNVITISAAGSYSGWTAVFEGSDDGSTWYPMVASRTDSGLAEIGPTTLGNSLRTWDIALGGISNFRARTTALTAGTVNVGITAQTMPYEPVPSAIVSPAPFDKWGSAETKLATSANVVMLAGASGAKWALSTVTASMNFSTAAGTTVALTAGSRIWSATLTNQNPYASAQFIPPMMGWVASAGIVAALSASIADVGVVVTGFKVYP